MFPSLASFAHRTFKIGKHRWREISATKLMDPFDRTSEVGVRLAEECELCGCRRQGWELNPTKSEHLA